MILIKTVRIRHADDTDGQQGSLSYTEYTVYIQYRYCIPPPEAYKMINKVALYCSVADAAKFPPATAKIFNITFVHLQDAFL